MKSNYQYTNGTSINNYDMVRMENGEIGFVYFDESEGIWLVKHLNSKGDRSVVTFLNAIYTELESI